MPRTQTACYSPHVTVHAAAMSSHPRLGTCCHLISLTETLVENISNQALRRGSRGSFCKLLMDVQAPLRTLFSGNLQNTRFD